MGAAVLGAEEAMLWLDQAARTHIYTTAMPPALAHAVHTALQLVREETTRRDRLAALIHHWRQGVARLPAIEVIHAPEPPESSSSALPRLPFSRTPIQPLILGSPEQTLAIEQALAQAGFFVPRSATHRPRGSARLRFPYAPITAS